MCGKIVVGVVVLMSMALNLGDWLVVVFSTIGWFGLAGWVGWFGWFGVIGWLVWMRAETCVGVGRSGLVWKMVKFPSFICFLFMRGITSLS